MEGRAGRAGGGEREVDDDEREEDKKGGERLDESCCIPTSREGDDGRVEDVSRQSFDKGADQDIQKIC